MATEIQVGQVWRSRGGGVSRDIQVRVVPNEPGRRLMVCDGGTSSRYRYMKRETLLRSYRLVENAEVEAPPVTDLMAALKASLAAVEGSRGD